MSSQQMSARATVIPVLRYRDCPTAIDWLCKTFGFEQQLVVSDPSGSIRHAQLTYGNGMVMLGSVITSDARKPQDCCIAQSAGLGLLSVHIIVAEVDQHYARSVACGAEIVMAIQDEDYGGRAYACRDPEGHEWSFGSYNPWAK